MRLAIITCEKYHDALPPFFKLLERFWPTTSTPWLVSDGPNFYAPWLGGTSPNFIPIEGSGSWCNVLRAFVSKIDDDPIIMQDDFFLTSHVNQESIIYAYSQMKATNSGCVRLFPCPGADTEYGDPYVGTVRLGTRYRISCQAAIYSRAYLLKILSKIDGTAADFEIQGTKVAEDFEEPVLAWKREVEPWPLSYLCSAISRGKWSRDAKKLCDDHGILVDWEKRGFEA